MLIKSAYSGINRFRASGALHKAEGNSQSVLSPFEVVEGCISVAADVVSRERNVEMNQYWCLSAVFPLAVKFTESGDDWIHLPIYDEH